MLHLISDHVDVDPNDNNTNNFQSAAVISLGLIAFGEEVGMDMSKRIVNHMFQYGEPHIKAAAPFALTLLGITSPDNNLMD
jgi:26S proteasome regulatory subunit N1